jgi:hypothetical protein
MQNGATEPEIRREWYPVPTWPDGHVARGLDQWVTSLGVETARLLCVSSDDDNDDLWRRYAENHSGVVLGFRHVEEYSTPLLAARQVSYADAAPVVASGCDFLLYGDTAKLRRKAFDAIFMTKSSAWSCQCEWRALTWRPNETGLFGDYRFYEEELASVTCGRTASAEFCRAITTLVSGRFPDCTLKSLGASA